MITFLSPKILFKFKNIFIFTYLLIFVIIIFVFFLAIVEIFLRILTFIKNNIGLKDVSNVIGKYIPENMFFIIDKYTYKIPSLCIILKWCFVLIMAIFLGYIIKIFAKRKRI